MINKDEACLVIVDVQGKLAEMVYDSERLLANIERLVQAVTIFNVPILWLEQYPKGLGKTSEQIAQHLTHQQPIEKIEFNACLNAQFTNALQQTARKQMIVCGIESHICVYQTAASLQQLGYEVEVVVDAVSSRTEANKMIGIDKMKAKGIAPTATESVIYELMARAGTPEFKQILPLIK